MMDTFYHIVYGDIFFYWILGKEKTFLDNHITLSISRNDELGKTIMFDSEKCQGFLSIWEHHIIEQVIFDKKTQTNVFYLHYNFLHFKQMIHLFNEFYNELIAINKKEDIKIAFCCTDGLSTSLFVKELLEVCQLQKIDYQLESISIKRLYDCIYKYSAIYLAPQIAYLRPYLMQDTNNKIPIYCIDATLFATKNYQEVLKTIQKDLKNQ